MGRLIPAHDRPGWLWVEEEHVDGWGMTICSLPRRCASWPPPDSSGWWPLHRNDCSDEMYEIQFGRGRSDGPLR